MDVLVPHSASNPGFVVNDNGCGGKVRDCATTDQVANLGLAGMNTTNANGVDVRGSVERNGFEARSTTQNFGLENLNSSRKEGFETREEVDKFGFFNASRTELYGLKNFEATKDAMNDILLQNCNKFESLNINMANNFKDSLLQAANNTAAIQMAACVNAKDAEITATRNAAAIAAQVAECCCEIRTEIANKACHTEQLIRQLDENRVRDELARTREELVALRLRASLTPPLVGSVPL